MMMMDVGINGGGPAMGSSGNPIRSGAVGLGLARVFAGERMGAAQKMVMRTRGRGLGVCHRVEMMMVRIFKSSLCSSWL